MEDQPASIELLIVEVAGGDKIRLEPKKDGDKFDSNDGHKIVALNLNSTGTVLLIQDNTRASLRIDFDSLSALNLSRSNLNTLPEVFGGLRLEELNLSHNRFEYVPDCLRNGLRFLEILDLSHNCLRLFDVEPKCVRKLRVLKLDYNELIGIPAWILNVNCFNLEELYFGHNEMVVGTTKWSRFHLESCYALRRLELNNCLVHTEDVPFLKHIRTLNVLNLSNEGRNKKNCFADYDSFAELFKKPSWNDTITVLRLDNLYLSFLPEDITQLIVLEELYLRGNNLYWLPDSVVHLKKLRILDLSRNSISYLPKGFGEMKNLTILMVAHNNISQVPEFDERSNIKRLDFYDNSLNEDCAFKLTDHIEEIDFEMNFFNALALGCGYQNKKDAYRVAVCAEERTDGQNVPEIERSETASSSGSSYDEEDCVNQEILDDYDVQECWEEVCDDNGCTASDNEWTGTEKTIFKRKKSKVNEVPAEWLFEDVS